MGSILWAFLPDEALPLVIASIGLLLIVGLLKPRRAVALIGGLVAWIVVAPFIDALFDLLPWWALFLVVGAMVLTLLRVASALLLGDGATDHLAGILAADFVRAVLRLLFWPFRLVFPRSR